MSVQSFKAMVVRETDDRQFVPEIAQKGVDDLPDGDVLIQVAYSSLNYKDALSATGHKGITRRYPHTPGIDAAGVVVESADPAWAPGDEVIVTGFDLGMNTSGGFGQYIRVPASWAVKLPENLTLRESMVYGTAGFTAALCLRKIEKSGVKPADGDILVTGATGGLGSLAVGMFARVGYRVVAATGKPDKRDYLIALGATEVIAREEVDDAPERPLSRVRWAGVVDPVGGDLLSAAIKSTARGGVVTCCGLVASAELSTSVYPFILRGVSLLGIDSAECPMDVRQQTWHRISGEWKLDQLDALATECSLEALEASINLILQGQLKGRVVVNPNA